jgi:hypothetical protein
VLLWAHDQALFQPRRGAGQAVRLPGVRRGADGVIYGILDANRDELKIDGKTKRTTSYEKAYAAWRRLSDVIICYLVCWECDNVFRVLEPRQ